MFKFFLILSSAIWLLSGCQLSMRPSTASELAPIPESKLLSCEALAKLKSGSHNDVELWAVETVFAYRLCAERHESLIDAVRVRQEAMRDREK